MHIQSSAFEPNSPIPVKYTCKGEGVSPPLDVTHVPTEAKSLALIMHDPDAPRGDFMHWVLWNIDPTISHILEGEAPAGCSEGLNDFSTAGYGGPCPHAGTHRYVFSLYALNMSLTLPGTSDGRAVRAALQPFVIERAELVGLCSAE